MANRRISLNKIKEIIRLKNDDINMSERKIAKALDISRKTVSLYLNGFKKSGLSYEDLSHLSDSEIKDRIFCKEKKELIVRYAEIEKLFEYFEQELKRTGVTRELLWKEYIQNYPNGYSYSQFCYHFQQWKKHSDVTMVLEHKAGDKLFVDFTGKKMVITDKTTLAKKEVEVFVSILGSSQLIYAQAVFNQKKESFIQANENAFWYYGGVVNAIVPDCLKSGVSKSNQYEPDINPEYADFARHYNTVILPARPYHPKDKALVENAVKNVYTHIFAPLRDETFYSIENLNSAIREKLELFNKKHFQRMKISRRDLFEEVEKKELKPLPLEQYLFRKQLKVKVQFNYHVEIREDHHYYSVPWKYKGEYVQVRYSQTSVEIYYDNQRIAFHSRELTKGKYTTNPDHRPPHHQFYADWSPQRFKSWAKNLGESVLKVIEKVLDNCKYPEQGFKICLGILNLSNSYGKVRLNKACEKMLYFEHCSYKKVRNILDKGLDLIEEQTLFDRQLPIHENIRGINYYR